MDDNQAIVQAQDLIAELCPHGRLSAHNQSQGCTTWQNLQQCIGVGTEAVVGVVHKLLCRSKTANIKGKSKTILSKVLLQSAHGAWCMYDRICATQNAVIRTLCCL